MKTVTVVCTGTWTTELEVEDDFNDDSEGIRVLIEENKKDFDFQDGSVKWEVLSVEIGGDELQVDMPV